MSPLRGDIRCSKKFSIAASAGLPNRSCPNLGSLRGNRDSWHGHRVWVGHLGLVVTDHGGQGLQRDRETMTQVAEMVSPRTDRMPQTSPTRSFRMPHGHYNAFAQIQALDRWNAASHVMTLLATMSLCSKNAPGCSNVTSPSVSPIRRRGDVAAAQAIYPSPLGTNPCFQRESLDVQQHMGARRMRARASPLVIPMSSDDWCSAHQRHSNFPPWTTNHALFL